MELSKRAKLKATEIINLLFKEKEIEDKSIISSFIDDHFHYSRYYGEAWKKPFNEQIKNEFNALNFNDKNIEDDLKLLFSYDVKLNELQLNNIKSISKTKTTKPIFFNYESNLNNLHFVIDYKNYLIS